MRVQWQIIIVLAAAGVLVSGCSEGDKPAATADSSPAASSETVKNSGYEPFTPATDPCSLIQPQELSGQGTAPLTTTPSTDDSGIQTCRYEDAEEKYVTKVTMFKHRGLADSYRELKQRAINSGGVEVLILTEERQKCGADLVQDDKVVQFEFEPTPQAVTAAALPSGQTWCDFSAPIVAQAGKKLGWAK